jgi:hypothetical protein
MSKPSRRSNASRARLSWFVLVSAGACSIAACSDDEAGEPKAASMAGEGGEGGEAQAGTGAKPSAGSNNVGGMPDSAGQGGVGGELRLPPVGEVCTACAATECAEQLDACKDNPECAPWLGCLSACEDEACISACDGEHADVARIYTGVYECLCDSCEDACGVAKACDKSQCVDDDALPASAAIPATLAETGLYAGYAIAENSGGAGGGGGADGSGGAPMLEPGVAPLTLASYVRRFEPKYPLWADGAEKDRFIYIPKCSTIDTSDMDHWRFPVGTRIWKQFSVDTDVGVAGSKRVETRLMHHFGPGQQDWLFAAYQWNESAPDDPAATTFVPEGVANANGTTHDIPSTGQCLQCHGGLPEQVLGFGAFQLSHDGSGDDLTIESISHLGWLSEPAPDGFDVPGTAVQQAALGYLHGNCGGCHYQGALLGAALVNDNTPLIMRLVVGQKSYAGTDTVASAVGVTVGSGNAAIVGKPRIDPMEPDNSALLLRMTARGTALQMPPLGTSSTKLPDTEGGVADVTGWINSIPKN